MIGKTFTVLEIGAGEKFLRAFRTAKEHPDWHVIAIDPNLKTEQSELRNLTLIRSHFPHPKIISERHLVDRVEIHNVGNPLMHTAGRIAPPAYSWLNDENPWLSEHHEIHIVDSMTTIFYGANRHGFDTSFEFFESILKSKGYTIELKILTRDAFKPISEWEIIHAKMHPVFLDIVLKK